MTFRLSAKQQEAQRMLAGPFVHLCLEGGSRSGKTLLFCRSIMIRAIKAPESSHAMFRLRFNHIRASVIADTWPKMISMCFPEFKRLDWDRSDWVYPLPNGSRIWAGGLDDKDRTDKVLGQEHATVFLNETSQIPYSSREVVLSRLAQNVQQNIEGKKTQLPLRVYYDLNPRTKGHWVYKLFHLKIDPTSKVKAPLANPEDYAVMQINPTDNRDNLPPQYFKILENLTGRSKKRFFDGEYSDENSNALWTEEILDQYRVFSAPLDITRAAVALDPSATEHGNECGIIGGGLGLDGRGYLLEDRSVQGRPREWAEAAIQLYRDLSADRIVAESNNGGQMIEDLIHAVDPTIPVILVHASRGKITRAEPISALYEKGFVSHAGSFPDLEDEMTTYSTPVEGEAVKPSPNRMDAVVWLWTYLLGNPVVALNDETIMIEGESIVQRHMDSPLLARDVRNKDEDEDAVVNELVSASGGMYL